MADKGTFNSDTMEPTSDLSRQTAAMENGEEYILCRWVTYF